MAVIYMVRHGRATAGWDTDPDPGLDELGGNQARAMATKLGPLGPLALVSSPLRRCRETAQVLAIPWNMSATLEPNVAEIPSPEGVAMAQRVDWLRTAMTSTWTQLGPRYTAFRDGVASFLLSLSADTVICSHFVAINAAIGAATGTDAVLTRSLDNCSITVFEVQSGTLDLVDAGHEADTLIR